MLLKIPFFNKRKLIIDISVKPSYEETIVSILKNNRWQNDDGLWMPSKVKAIKFHRSVESVGLAESKDFIDKIIVDYKIYPLETWDSTKIY